MTKRVTKQKVKPKKFISENFVVSRTQDTSIQIFTRATPLVVRKIVNFSSKGTATHMSETSFSTLPSFFTPTLRVCMDRQRAYADVITKFSGMDRFPFSIGIGVRCQKCARPPPLKQTKTIHMTTSEQIIGITCDTAQYKHRLNQVSKYMKVVTKKGN